MGLKTENTHWIFLLASLHEPDSRHVYDIKLGIDALLYSNIAHNNITVVIDSDKQQNTQLIREINGFENKYIYKSSQLTEIFQKNVYDNVVLFVNGHGDIHGLSSNPPITPHFLFSSLQNAPNLRRGIIFLGQCFAGIFNYMPVMARGKEEDKRKLPPLIVVGGTGLDISISSAFKSQKTKSSYQVNIFFYCLFEWIREPKDIDGDGNYSLTDAYKYVGYRVIAFCHEQKANYSIKIQQYIRELEKDIEKPVTEMDSNVDKKLAKSQIDTFKRQLLLYDNPQEPWLLNAIEATNVYF